MDIDVSYVAQVQSVTGKATETISLEGPATVRTLAEKLIDTHGPPLGGLLLDPDGAPRKSILVFLGDDQLDWNDPKELKDGDKVMLLSPLSGG